MEKCIHSHFDNTSSLQGVFYIHGCVFCICSIILYLQLVYISGCFFQYLRHISALCICSVFRYAVRVVKLVNVFPNLLVFHWNALYVFLLYNIMCFLKFAVCWALRTTVVFQSPAPSFYESSETNGCCTHVGVVPSQEALVNYLSIITNRINGAFANPQGNIYCTSPSMHVTAASTYAA